MQYIKTESSLHFVPVILMKKFKYLFQVPAKEVVRVGAIIISRISVSVNEVIKIYLNIFFHQLWIDNKVYTKRFKVHWSKECRNNIISFKLFFKIIELVKLITLNQKSHLTISRSKQYPILIIFITKYIR